MTNTTINAKTLDLGEVEFGDTLYALVELECMDEGRKRNGKAGTVYYKKAVIKTALRLVGALPEELATELRRQARENEESETGIAVVPGLEGFLDNNGVVVTEADRGGETPPAEPKTKKAKKAKPATKVDDAEAAWLALGVQVHQLRGVAVAGGTDAKDAQASLDALFATFNAIEVDDELVDDDDGLLVVKANGDTVEAIELPDFELELAAGEDDPAEGAFNASQDGTLTEPWEGYERFTADDIVAHVDEYIDADKALGGPSLGALEYVAGALAWERANGERPYIVAALEGHVARLSDAVGGELADASPDVDAGGPPWETYPKDTADTIVAHLRRIAERDPEEARPLIEVVRSFEAANKNRKGVLGRIDGLVPPPLPITEETDLDAGEDLTNALDELSDDAHDEEVEPA